jgi:hypothetical protein
MSRPPGSRTFAAVLAVACIASVAACTSSTSGTGSTPSTNISAPSSEPVPTDSDVTLPTESTSLTASPITTPASPTPTKTAAGDGCTFAQLTIRVIRGGAIAGQEIALITFTNASVKTCTMFGFPGVSLRRGGALLGKPATRSAKTPATVRLAPSAQAEALLRDFTTCQASLSDTVRVYPPDSTQFVDKPLELRGCQIVIDPVSHS